MSQMNEIPTVKIEDNPLMEINKSLGQAVENISTASLDFIESLKSGNIPTEKELERFSKSISRMKDNAMKTKKSCSGNCKKTERRIQLLRESLQKTKKSIGVISNSEILEICNDGLDKDEELSLKIK
tara:strand:- start:362 stop:742 length:381 start_codon:yes stop_codon:yes gene_type:complete